MIEALLFEDEAYGDSAPITEAVACYNELRSSLMSDLRRLRGRKEYALEPDVWIWWSLVNRQLHERDAAFERLFDELLGVHLEF